MNTLTAPSELRALQTSRCTLIIPHGFEANYVVGFAKGLAANRVSMKVLSSDETAQRLADAGIRQLNIRGSQDSKRTPLLKAANLVRYYYRLAREVVRHRGSTIHFIGLLNSRFILIEGVLIPLWLRLWSGCYIHTAHNALPHSREHSGFFRFAYRWIYHFPHVILAHNDRTASQLKSQFGVSADRIRTISIGLNEEVPRSALSAAAARKALGLNAPGKLFLVFGKIERYKGVDLLLRAWERVADPGASLVIAGLCPDSNYKAELQALAAASKRSDSIVWRDGFVPNAEVSLLLAAADAVVLPYRHIYQSGVIFLCLSHGTPVIATSVGSMPDFITPTNGILAGAPETDALAQSLNDFLQRSSSFDREAIAQESQKYRWENQCSEILLLY